jgi:hypothetical protein
MTHVKVMKRTKENTCKQGLRVLLRNETWKVGKCERQTETEENKSNFEYDRLLGTRENSRNKKVTITFTRKTKAE